MDVSATPLPAPEANQMQNQNEGDPLSETQDTSWHGILQIPQSKAEQFEKFFISEAQKWNHSTCAERQQVNDIACIQMMNNSVKDKSDIFFELRPSSLKLKFEDNARRGQLLFDDEVLGFKVKEFPGVVEVCKTFNKSDIIKVGNVSQVIICDESAEIPPITSAEIENDHQIPALQEEKMKANRHPHGLTPPMKNVVKHRFRKTKKSRYIAAPDIELQLRGIFRRDMEASKITFKLVDASGEEEDADFIGLTDIENPNPVVRPVTSDFYENHDYRDIDLEALGIIVDSYMRSEEMSAAEGELNESGDVESIIARLVDELISKVVAVESKQGAKAKTPAKKRTRAPPNPATKRRRNPPRGSSNKNQVTADSADAVVVGQVAVEPVENSVATAPAVYEVSIDDFDVGTSEVAPLNSVIVPTPQVFENPAYNTRRRTSQNAPSS